jgi:hypothetical protein
MVSLVRVFATLSVALLVLGCGGGQDKGIYKDLDRPRSTEKNTKGNEKGSKALRIQRDAPLLC